MTSLALPLAGYLCAVLMSAIAASATVAMGAGADGISVVLAGQVGFWATLMATVAVARRTHETRERERRLAVDLALGDLPRGALLGVATQLVLVPLIYLPIRTLVDLSALEEPAQNLLGGLQGADLVAMAVGVVVIAPVVEELFFRGLLLESIRARWNTAIGITGSSLVFGATHFQLLQLPALTLAGAVFAAAAVHSDRLGPAITTHAAFNATTFSALVIFR